MSFEEAASFPLALQTAQEGFDRVNFQRGQSVFIVGGAGGVGSLAIQVKVNTILLPLKTSRNLVPLQNDRVRSFNNTCVVQLAKYVYGASKIATTTSTGKVDFVRQLGADTVIDYTKQSYDQIPQKFDFVFDTVGDSHRSYVVAKEKAKIIDIANPSPHPRAEFFIVTASGSNLERLRGYIECEKLKPVIDPISPYSFSNVMEAFKHIESGRARGKIVISPID
uniref:Enoyl reductase (ER) domain-containing protein n=1 Tax=Picea sitchensis TaxID=3332 RepID=B8LMT8_PICSI|nr:unknown [Picea sitchensis]